MLGGLDIPTVVNERYLYIGPVMFSVERTRGSLRAQTGWIGRLMVKVWL